MKKEYRIKKNIEIENILKGRAKTGNKNYIIYIKENSEANHFRLAMSVSKKIGNAVVRNRSKRLIKQVFLQFKEEILFFSQERSKKVAEPSDESAPQRDLLPIVTCHNATLFLILVVIF